MERKRSHLRYFDFRTQGAYCLTLSTHERACTLARAEEGDLVLTDYGEIVEQVMQRIPTEGKLTVDRYVIMPNHLHVIVAITDEEELRRLRETPAHGRATAARVINFIKMNVSKEIARLHGRATVWERGALDHVIRDLYDYENIVKHIDENPAHWQSDGLYCAP